MTRSRRLLAYLAVSCAMLVPMRALAWIDTGHMIVAAIASHDLKPRVRAQIDELLKVGGDARTSDFYGAACWADDYKTKENGKWHYIDNYFREDGKPAQNKPDAENVVWAIDKFSKILADKSQSTEDRAQALRFVIHFVGDIHQPLHATSRESDDMPKGDAGGNRVVIADIPGIGMWHPNLHALWDFACGYYESVSRPLHGPEKDEIDDYAEKIMTDYPEAKLPSSKDLNPTDWMNESVIAAKKYVYPGIVANQAPSDQYLTQGKQVCEERLALAGYRLAGLLNKLLN